MKKLILCVVFILSFFAQSSIYADPCDNQMPGDADGNGFVDISDLVYLSAFINFGGPAPVPLANGDPNGDCKINVGDLIYLSNIPHGGLPPVECTCDNPDFGQTACCFNIRGNYDYDPMDLIDITDLVKLIDDMWKTKSSGAIMYYRCIDEANIDGDIDDLIDISDVVYLVDYMFTDGPQPKLCP